MNILRIIGASILLWLSADPLAYADTPSADDGIYLIYLPSALRQLNSYTAQIGCMSPDEAREHVPAAVEVLKAGHLLVGRLETQPQDLVTILTISGDNTVVLAKGDCAASVRQEWQNSGRNGDELRIVTLVEDHDDVGAAEMESALGDISTLADPGVVNAPLEGRKNR
jgi:hypothetical protein